MEFSTEANKIDIVRDYEGSLVAFLGTINSDTLLGLYLLRGVGYLKKMRGLQKRVIIRDTIE